MRFKHVLILILLLLAPSLMFGGITDSSYSVKNRWVVKASASAYRTFDNEFAMFRVGFYYEYFVKFQQMNYRIEASYAFSKNFEIGLLAGLQTYNYYDVVNEAGDYELAKTVAPAFGLNLNFQLLPLLVNSQRCRWDLYLRAGYEGCILPHFEYGENMTYPEESTYRQTYGVGLGLAYYFKNRIGLFGELSVGNYSLFPRYTESNINFRFGIATKFNYK